MKFRTLIELLPLCIMKKDVDALFSLALDYADRKEITRKEHDAFCNVASRIRDHLPE